MIKEGVMVISHNLQPVYLNLKAREICQKLWNGNYHSDTLPPVIADIYHRSIRNFSAEDSVLIMDCRAGEQTIRIRACNLILEVDELNQSSSERPWLLVFLEDRNANLQEELQIEQKKYDLTDRETQILNLLLQAYTYQEIVKTLQISLNTVKFHVKNINAKKRSCLESEKKMYSTIKK
jgi:hypothetical protein